MRSFWKNTAGNVGLLFGIALPVLATSAAVAVQYSQLASRRSALQQAADSGAIAAAQQLKLANASDSVVASVASSTVQANVVTISDPISVQTQVLQKRTGVTVTVTDTVPLSWARL
jgi:Flp pilus assembly protein TadG